jgi:hypothetical protein
LSESECEHRIEEISRSTSFVADATGKPAITWKPLFGRKRVHAWYPAEARSPWLRGTFQSDGTGAIIVGRSGADFLTLFAAGALEAVIVYMAVRAGTLEVVPLALLPVVYFILRRSSPHGEQLIDFVQQVLEAEDVLARRGDPIRY